MTSRVKTIRWILKCLIGKCKCIPFFYSDQISYIYSNLNNYTEAMGYDYESLMIVSNLAAHLLQVQEYDWMASSKSSYSSSSLRSTCLRWWLIGLKFNRAQKNFKNKNVIFTSSHILRVYAIFTNHFKVHLSLFPALIVKLSPLKLLSSKPGMNYEV